MNNLPALIRQHRLAANLTQTALANAVGVTLGTVARWEAGTRTPSLARLEGIGAALGVRFVITAVPDA